MIGDFRHLVTFQAPGPPIADGKGGYTQAWTDLDPATWYVRISPATTQDQERLAAGSVITHASSLVTGRFHPGVTTETQMLFVDAQGRERIYAVAGVGNVDERGEIMELLAVEVPADEVAP